MRQLFAYLLLLVMATILVPRELVHHCEMSEHHCESQGLHLDDSDLHLVCDVCDFKLSTSEELSIDRTAFTKSAFALLRHQPVLSTAGENASFQLLRGPPRNAAFGQS